MSFNNDTNNSNTKGENIKLNIIQSSELLYQALAYLADSDTDHATRVNNIGFNQVDNSFGHDMSRRHPSTWTIKQYMAVRRMLVKYSRTQVSHIIPDYSLLFVATLNDQSPRDAYRSANGESPDSTPDSSSNTASSTATNTAADSSSVISIGKDGYNRDVIICRFRYSSSLIEALRSVRAQYNPVMTARNKPYSIWLMPFIESGAIGALKLIESNTFTADNATIVRLRSLIVDSTPVITDAIAKQYVASDLVIPGLAEDIKPYSFQNDGIAFMANNKRVILADDMGTGKTLQSLSTLAVLDSYPAIVIVPLVVKGNWLRETRRFFPTKRVAYIGPESTWKIKDQIFDNNWETADIVVINYDIVLKHIDQLMARQWRAIICDESHYVKNRDAQRTAAVAKLATGYDTRLRRNVTDGIGVRLLLTGTPILNRPAELISPLSIIDRLRNPFGGYASFMKRYCGAYYNGYATVSGEPTNLDELAEILRTNIMIRRTKREVLPFLPGKSRTMVTVPLSNRAVYSKAESDVARFLSEMAFHDQSIIESAQNDGIALGLSGDDLASHINDAREYNARSAESRAKRAEILVAYNTLRQLAANGKYESIVEWIDNFTDQYPDEKLVVFAHHNDLITKLARKYNAPKIIGGVSNADRTNIVERFQTDPNVKILICSTRAGGVGITLTASSTVLICELDWTPGNLDQAEDRVNRIGQESHCDIYYVLADQSVDDDMYRIIETKRNVIHAAIGDSDEDLIETSMMDAVTSGILSRNR